MPNAPEGNKLEKRDSCLATYNTNIIKLEHWAYSTLSTAACVVQTGICAHILIHVFSLDLEESVCIGAACTGPRTRVL